MPPPTGFDLSESAVWLSCAWLSKRRDHHGPVPRQNELQEKVDEDGYLLEDWLSPKICCIHSSLFTAQKEDKLRGLFPWQYPATVERAIYDRR